MTNRPADFAGLTTVDGGAVLVDVAPAVPVVFDRPAGATGVARFHKKNVPSIPIATPSATASSHLSPLPISAVFGADEAFGDRHYFVRREGRRLQAEDKTVLHPFEGAEHG